MKIQTCSFKRNEDSHNEIGLAFLQAHAGFGDSLVLFIVDLNGRKLNCPWDYTLINKPLNQIDTDY